MAKINIPKLRDSFLHLQGQVKNFIEHNSFIDEVRKGAEARTKKIKLEVKKEIHRDSVKVKRIISSYKKELVRLKTLIPEIEKKQKQLKGTIEKQIKEVEKTIYNLLGFSMKSKAVAKVKAKRNLREAVKKAGSKTRAKKETSSN